jgi:hypothetical protein
MAVTLAYKEAGATDKFIIGMFEATMFLDEKDATIQSDNRIMFNKENTWWEIAWLKEVQARRQLTV